MTRRGRNTKGNARSGVSHHAYFKFSGGVQPGTAVRYGGMRVGTVQRVRIDPGDSTRIEVDLNVDLVASAASKPKRKAGGSKNVNSTTTIDPFN